MEGPEGVKQELELAIFFHCNNQIWVTATGNQKRGNENSICAKTTFIPFHLNDPQQSITLVYCLDVATKMLETIINYNVYQC